MSEPGWRQEGDEPDYRFSLANERTFLAWIRTALALVVGAIAIHQLAPELAPERIRVALSVLLALGGALLGCSAYRRWERNERAMRHAAPLPHTRLLLIVTFGTAAAAAVVCALVGIPR